MTYQDQKQDQRKDPHLNNLLKQEHHKVQKSYI